MNVNQIRVKAKVAGALVAASATLGLGIVASTPAHADSSFSTAYTGMGSDTTQDIMNALSGAATGTPPIFRLPVHSSPRSGNKVISSWDAVDPVTNAAGCILPKLGGPLINRPNGSGKGIQALSDAIAGVAFAPDVTCGVQAAGNMTGQIDFARSSAQPSGFTAGTALTWIPLGRDAVGYAYYDHGTNELANLTTLQLQQLFGTGNVATGGTITVNGHTVEACMVQAGSGTGKTWDIDLGNTGSEVPLTATTSANASGCGSTYEENGANTFLTAVQALPGGGATGTTDFVIPFSTGSWISQVNLVAKDRTSTGHAGGVDMGAIDALGKAYSGTGTATSPNATFYASSPWGRNLWNVIDSARKAEAGLVSLFGQTSTTGVCSQSALISQFGFSAPTDATRVGFGCGYGLAPGDNTVQTATKP